MKTAQIREMKIEELKAFIEEKRAEAVKLRFDIASRQAKNHRQYREIRKDIAKAMTVIGELEQKSN